MQEQSKVWPLHRNGVYLSYSQDTTSSIELYAKGDYCASISMAKINQIVQSVAGWLDGKDIDSTAEVFETGDSKLIKEMMNIYKQMSV